MKKLLKHFKRNWHKYLLEILVVVVGVLIAFSLNNWNENNKIRQLEKATLTEISDALETDLSQLQNWIKIKQLQDTNVLTMVNYLKYDSVGEKDINNTWQSGFLRPLYVFNTSPYDLLKSRGFDIIHDDEIRNEIQNYYDISLPNLIDYLNRNYELMSDFRNTYMRYIYREPNQEKFVASDLDALRTDEIINGLSMVLFWHQQEKVQLSNLQMESEKLHSDLEEYLKRM